MDRCMQCSKETVNPKFCGRSCAAIFNNSKKPKRAPEGKCKDCGQPIAKSRLRCRPCRLAIPKAAGPTYTAKERERQAATYRTRRQLALDFLGAKCVRCGALDKLEFDHIDRTTKSFEMDQTVKQKLEVFWQEIGKCQLLCRPCHIAKSREYGDTPKRIQDPEHGTWAKHTRDGCRCDKCRAWRKLYIKKLVDARGIPRAGVSPLLYTESKE